MNLDDDDDDDDAETWLDGCLAACLTCLCNMYKLSFSLAPAHLSSHVVGDVNAGVDINENHCPRRRMYVWLEHGQTSPVVSVCGKSSTYFT